MRFRSTTTPGSEHWSKDFVEHLRTVHFALVTVSVGLIVLLSSKPYDAKVAAREINDITTFRDQFSSDPLKVWDFTFGISDPALGSAGNVEFNPWLDGSLDGKQYTFRFPEHPRLICEYYSDERNKGNWKFTDSVPYNTVAQFTKWWNIGTLQFDRRVFEINRVAAIAFVRSEAPAPDRGTQEISLRKSEARSNNAVVVRPEGNCAPYRDPYSKESQFAIPLVGDLDDNEFRIFVTGVTMLRIDTSELATRYHLRKEPFAKSFEDLDRASRGREDFSLDALAMQLYAEASKEEAFDAFGIKLPSEQITRWGIVILMGVELYLLMYLKRLSNKLRKDDPGWDTPWMAMDQSYLGKGMLFISLVLLPLFAVALVLYRSIHNPYANDYAFHVFRFTLHSTIIQTSIGACICVVLSILCWKYRPRIKDPSATAPDLNSAATDDWI